MAIELEKYKLPTNGLRTGLPATTPEITPQIKPLVKEPKRLSFLEQGSQFKGSPLISTKNITKGFSKLFGIGKAILGRGIEPLGKGLGLTMFKHLTPEGRKLSKAVKEGTANEHELRAFGEIFSEAPTPKETVASAGSILGNLLLFSSPKNALTMSRQIMHIGGASALLGASEAAVDGKNIRGIITQGGISGAIGAAIPPIFKGAGIVLGKGARRLPDIFNLTTGGQKAAFQFQLKHPQASKTAIQIGKSFDDIAKDGIKAVNIVKQKANVEYVQGINAIQKKYPRKLFKVNLGSIDDIFKKVGQDFDITASKAKGVIFAKAGRVSPIGTGVEQKRIKELYGVLANWKDLSGKGSGKLLNKVNSMRKFTEGVSTKESAFVQGVLKEIRAPIYSAYPEMQGVFNNYSAKLNLYSAADEIFKATKLNSPTKQATGVSKVASIFDENKEPLFRLTQQLEKETGVSVLKELAVAETKAMFPNLIRTVAGIGGVVASISNPVVLMALPFMTQRSAAAMTRGAGRALQTGPGFGQVVRPAAAKAVEGTRRLFNK